MKKWLMTLLFFMEMQVEGNDQPEKHAPEEHTFEEVEVEKVVPSPLNAYVMPSKPSKEEKKER